MAVLLGVSLEESNDEREKEETRETEGMRHGGRKGAMNIMKKI